jgi:hypothetical protein
VIGLIHPLGWGLNRRGGSMILGLLQDHEGHVIGLIHPLGWGLNRRTTHA